MEDRGNLADSCLLRGFSVSFHGDAGLLVRAVRSAALPFGILSPKAEARESGRSSLSIHHQIASSDIAVVEPSDDGKASVRVTSAKILGCDEGTGEHVSQVDYIDASAVSFRFPCKRVLALADEDSHPRRATEA